MTEDGNQRDRDAIPAASIPSWPLSRLNCILNEDDFKLNKTNRQNRLNVDKRISFQQQPEVNFEQQSEACCQLDDVADGLDACENEVDFPVLPMNSLRQLILTLLEAVVTCHGDVRTKTGHYLDETLLKFARDLFHPSANGAELRLLLRLILRSMVSHIQFRRALAADEVIHHVIDVSDLVSSGNSADYDADPTIAADVLEGMVRFLAAVEPVDDDVIFHQWLNSFHSQTCLRLVLWLLTTPLKLEWLSLIGRILTNVTGKT